MTTEHEPIRMVQFAGLDYQRLTPMLEAAIATAEPRVAVRYGWLVPDSANVAAPVGDFPAFKPVVCYGDKCASCFCDECPQEGR